MDNEEQNRLEAELKKEIGELVIKYAKGKLHPDTLSGALFVAGAKVATSMSMVLIEMGKKKSEEGGFAE